MRAVNSGDVDVVITRSTFGGEQGAQGGEYFYF